MNKAGVFCLLGNLKSSGYPCPIVIFKAAFTSSYDHFPFFSGLIFSCKNERERERERERNLETLIVKNIFFEITCSVLNNKHMEKYLYLTC